MLSAMPVSNQSSAEPIENNDSSMRIQTYVQPAAGYAVLVRCVGICARSLCIRSATFGACIPGSIMGRPELSSF